ncbi:MAG: right-handed parallel beta-helix repeat-containing protein [Polyangiales bacterium]
MRMLLIALGALLWMVLPVRADEYYVAPDGADTNPGTLDAPFASVERGQEAAKPGDTVYLRGGEYHFSGTQQSIGIALSKSGASGSPIKYFAYEGEQPILDLFELKPQARVTGIDIRANWLHLRGIEVRGVRQLIVGDSWGVRIRGDHNVVEHFNVHDNEAPGIFITSGASNLVLNCDSHHNYDPLENGGNADGFGCHAEGGDNVMRGCRAYENSDDGFDFINAAGSCMAEQSWSFRNGYIPDTDTTAANGAGFKSGGYGNPPRTPATGAARHAIRGSLAFANRAIGFYANYHPGGIDFFNNTAYDNPANFDMRTGGGATTTHKLRNNVALMPGRDIVSWAGGSDETSTWKLGISVSARDFAGVDKAEALAPRQADGSLPQVSFLRLADGSQLIDRGEDVGMPFTGSAPDLGAYEWGAEPTSNAGAGGSAAAGAGAAGLGGTGAAGVPGGAAMGGASGAAGAAGTPLTAAGSAAAGSGWPIVPAGGAAAGATSVAPTAAGAGAAAGPTAGNAAPAAAVSGGSSTSDGCSCATVRGRAGPPWPCALLLTLLALTRFARRGRLG